MTQRASYIFLFSCLAIISIVTIVLYLNFPLAYNQGLYHYQGLVMDQGGLPYNDFIEKKGPMGLLTYGMAAVIFDASAISYRLFDLLLQSITGIFLFLALKKQYPFWISIVAPILWFSHTLIDGPGNTADVTNIITLCAVGTLYLLTKTLETKHYWALGVLMALACWVKPTAFLIFLPVWYYVYMSNQKQDRSQLYRSVLKVVGGMVVVSGLFVIYLLVTASWKGFWEALVLDPLLNYVDDRGRLSWRVLKRVIYIFVQDSIVRITGLFGIFLILPNKITRMSRLFCLSIMLMILVEGKHFPYHFSPLWPFLIIGLLHLVDKVVLEKLKTSTALKTVLTTLFILILSYPLLFISQRFLEAGFTHSKTYDASETFLLEDFRAMHKSRQPMMKYLKSHFKKEDTVFALASDTNIYLELGKKTNCRFAREGLMLSHSNVPDYLKSWQEELMVYMKEEKPNWLIIDRVLPDVILPYYKQEIESLITKHYHPGETLGGYIVYHKK